METFQIIATPLLLTLKISVIATLFVAVLGILIAYILAKKEFPGKCPLPSHECPAEHRVRVKRPEPPGKKGKGKRDAEPSRDRGT